MENLLSIAFKELGVAEIPGPADNDRILKYAKDIGQDWVGSEDVPWCGIFVGWCMSRAGLSVPKKAASAKQYLKTSEYGARAVENPVPGMDIAVFHRGSPTSWKGHVGIFMGFNKKGDDVYVIGGNQGNMVSIAAYPKSRVAGYVRTDGPEGTLVLPPAILSKAYGGRGENIVLLQKALQKAGYACGVVDGLFGVSVEFAVKKLQREHGLTEDGVYDDVTRFELGSMLMR